MDGQPPELLRAVIWGRGPLCKWTDAHQTGCLYSLSWGVTPPPKTSFLKEVGLSPQARS